MRRCLRLFLCLPLLATTACAADAIAGPELAPRPEPQTVVRATPEARAVDEGAAARPSPPRGGLWPSSASLSPRPEGPMYIVDGVVVSSLAGLGADDIESVQLLTGASASSLFGTRAANGVIVVRTRAAASRRW